MSKLTRLLARVAPLSFPRLARGVHSALRRRLFRCSVCEGRIADFVPLERRLPGLVAGWKMYGFDVDLFTQAETFNFEQFACPLCGASDRSRLYALFIRGQVRAMRPIRDAGPGQKPRLLEIAPGKPLAKMIRALDCYEYRTAGLLMAGVDDEVDVADMSIYPDNSFDAFICSHVLEHVPDDRAAMAGLHRILKPGGWGIAMAPISLKLPATIEDIHLSDIAEQVRRFGQHDHLRIYARDDFIGKLRGAGFTVEQLGAQHFGAGVFEKHGITPRSVLYICRKS